MLDTSLIKDILPASLADSCFNALEQEVEFNHMCNQGRPVQRLVCTQGDCLESGWPIYRHPVDELPRVVPWTKTVLLIKQSIESKLGVHLNHVLIQYYRSPLDTISEHCDKTLDIVQGTPIINFTAGDTRTMVFRSKTKPRTTYRFELINNSALVVGPNTNQLMLHSIRPDKRDLKLKRPDETRYNGQRISLTFRQIGTFERDGLIYGQGAKFKILEHAQKIQDDPVEWKALLHAFSQENHSPDFDWSRYYGQGFNVVQGAPRRS